jgi:hypothetical protein
MRSGKSAKLYPVETAENNNDFLPGETDDFGEEEEAVLGQLFDDSYDIFFQDTRKFSCTC